MADIEWKIIYVGSAETEEKDQELESIMVGPVPVGTAKFVFEVWQRSCPKMCCLNIFVRHATSTHAGTIIPSTHTCHQQHPPISLDDHAVTSRHLTKRGRGLDRVYRHAHPTDTTPCSQCVLHYPPILTWSVAAVRALLSLSVPCCCCP